MSIDYEQQARLMMAARLRDAEHWRLVQSARRRPPAVKVWEVGSLVVAWRRRSRGLDTSDVCRETPVVLWM